MALGIVKVLCNPRTTWTPFDVEELPSVGIRFFVAFFFFRNKVAKRILFCCLCLVGNELHSRNTATTNEHTKIASEGVNFT